VNLRTMVSADFASGHQSKGIAVIRAARTSRLIGATVIASSLVLALGACGVTGKAGSAGDDSGTIKNLQVMVPNAPGSGYDVTGRAAVDGASSRTDAKSRS